MRNFGSCALLFSALSTERVAGSASSRGISGAMSDARRATSPLQSPGSARPGKRSIRFDLQPQYAPDYEVPNYYIATNPASHFRTTLMAARPFPGGR